MWQLFFFYIDLYHWKEDEFLLNNGSRFFVTGLDKENGFINVKVLINKTMLKYSCHIMFMNRYRRNDNEKY